MTTTSKTMPSFAEKDPFATVSNISEDEQITVADTGWSEENKEQMDGLGMTTWT